MAYSEKEQRQMTVEVVAGMVVENNREDKEKVFLEICSEAVTLRDSYKDERIWVIWASWYADRATKGAWIRFKNDVLREVARRVELRKDIAAYKAEENAPIAVEQPKKHYYVLLNSKTGQWDVHKAECSDVKKTISKRQCNSAEHYEGVDAMDVQNQILDEEIREMGYGEESVRIFPCCQDAKTEYDPKWIKK